MRESTCLKGMGPYPFRLQYALFYARGFIYSKEKRHRCAFIIISGAIGEENAVQLMKEGAHDYVMKGHIQRLVPVIKRELQEAEERKSRRKAEDLYRKSDFYC